MMRDDGRYEAVRFIERGEAAGASDVFGRSPGRRCGDRGSRLFMVVFFLAIVRVVVYQWFHFGVTACRWDLRSAHHGLERFWGCMA
jgi:hypothetical protein